MSMVYHLSLRPTFYDLVPDSASSHIVVFGASPLSTKAVDEPIFSADTHCRRKTHLLINLAMHGASLSRG